MIKLKAALKTLLETLIHGKFLLFLSYVLVPFIIFLLLVIFFAIQVSLVDSFQRCNGAVALWEKRNVA